LFSFTMVGVSILATGLVKKEFQSIVFPLNVFSTGLQANASSSRQLNWVMWCLLILCVLVFTVHFLYDVYIQYRINSELQKPKWSFITSFFAESWWNGFDLVAVILNIITQYYLFRYICVDSELEGWAWSSWTFGNYEFDHLVSENREDAFFNFARAAFFYEQYTVFAARSILFMSARTIKYMVAIQQLRLVVLTVSTAIWELLAMLLILILALFGFACMFFIYYGNRFTAFGTIGTSFCELFIFMSGVFDATPELFHANPIFFTIAFCLVQLIFYFVLANLFLAVVVYKWREVRRSAQEDAVSTAMSCWSSLSCVKRATEKESESSATKVPLNDNFWKSCAMLNFLDKFDEAGKIHLDRKTPAGKSVGIENGTGGDGGGHENEDEQASEMSAPYDIEKIFKKAQMEIASQMSATANVQPRDGGAGVQLDQTDQPAKLADDEGVKEFRRRVPLGIQCTPVEPDAAKKIEADLISMLQDDPQAGGRIVQEIWLDALVTVLEDVGTLKKVQEFFLPPPMMQPRNAQEHGNVDQQKVKMEIRLDKFLRLLVECTKMQHYRYLKNSAKTKEKGLKQQSLVFADYLDRLEQRIKELQQEIKVLERKNTDMRSHVAPLL